MYEHFPLHWFEFTGIFLNKDTGPSNQDLETSVERDVKRPDQKTNLPSKSIITIFIKLIPKFSRQYFKFRDLVSNFKVIRNFSA